MKNTSTHSSRPPTTPESKTNTVAVSRKHIKTGPASVTLEKRAQRILSTLGCTQCELSIVLSDDSFIQTLNREYRHKDQPTDVLSFPMNEGALQTPTGLLLGDIVISIETAARQAEELVGTLLDEVTSLLIHGILHLMGYTHENDATETQMKDRAFELLKLFKKTLFTS
jgi:probable rRNA maturation factor